MPWGFDVIAAVANVGAVFALVFAIYTYNRDTSRKARQDTLEAYKELQETVLSKINMWLPSETKAAAEDKKSDGYKTLSAYLSEIERFASALMKESLTLIPFISWHMDILKVNEGC